jgi:hypothetical protein
MIPPTPAKRNTCTLTPPAGTPAPDCCPTCGRPWDGFTLDASGLLDWIQVLEQDVRHLQRYAELLTVEETLP